MIIAWLKGTALPLRLHAPPGALPPSSIISIFISPATYAIVYRSQFYRYLYEILQAHCPRGEISTFPKNLRVGPPGGKYVPQIFF